MHIFFTGESANEVWLKAISHFRTTPCARQMSRSGPTLETLHSGFCISNPRQRWVFSRRPSINPAFAIAEVFWILAGKNNSRFLNYWNPLLPKFAGSAECYHGAYGYRIRHGFGFDQLEMAYTALQNNPDSRQVVIQIWDPRIDFPINNGAPNDEDIPCNICSLLKVRNGHLEWLQIMRSNDIFLGSPYNFIQFTTLQEILSGWLNLKIGSYTQICDSLHVYEHDISNINCYDDNISLINNDMLSISKCTSDEYIFYMYRLLDELTSIDLTKKRYNEIILSTCFNQSYLNLLLIAAADSARRRNWIEEMHESAGKCTNELLNYCWKHWQLRCSR